MRSLFLALLALLVTAVPAEAAVNLRKVGDFNQPVYVTGAPGDYSRIYVVEQSGRIFVVRNGTKLSTPFTDLSEAVLDGGERGLLSVAFRPDFATSRLLYVYFTNNAGNIEVAELRAASGDRADPTYLRRTIEIPHEEAANHNGGQLQFGRDGLLYLGTGDGGNAYDVPNRDALNTASLLGKILRIAPRRGGGYTVPGGNPFGNEVWSYGLRNPFRFSFDRATGDLTIGDVGQNTVEEVDYVAASAGAGRSANFGWDECEGSLDAEPVTTGAPCTFPSVRPVIEHSGEWCSVIGGYIVRDQTLPSLIGRYVYGDYCVDGLRSARLSPGRADDDRPLSADISSLSSFGEDTAGCIYATSLNGQLYRLVESSTQIPCPRQAGSGGDTGGPGLKVKVKKRQRVRRRRPAIVYARCSEACSIRVVAKLRTRGRTVRMRTVVKSGAANQRVKLRSRLTRRARRRLRRSLDLNRPAIIRIAVRARDASGNRSRLVRRRIRVRD